MTAVIATPTSANVARAVALLRAGELVAFPTETVYGLGADAASDDAVRSIFRAKHRPADHPVIVHVPDRAGISHWARDVAEEANRLADAFWPGPLTLILPRSHRTSDTITGGQDSVGLRVPSHPVAQALLRAFRDEGGHGIAAPSANRFGRISPTTAHHVVSDLGDDVGLVLDGGACEVGIESTIVALVGDEPVLVRPGGIALPDLARVLGRVPRIAAPDAPRASGTLPSHYAPHTPARLVAAADLRGVEPDVAVLARTVAPPVDAARWITAPDEPVAYAHDLYANLRALDATGARGIVIEDAPETPAWQAVRDRLVRATRGDGDDRD